MSSWKSGAKLKRTLNPRVIFLEIGENILFSPLPPYHWKFGIESSLNRFYAREENQHDPGYSKAKFEFQRARDYVRLQKLDK